MMPLVAGQWPQTMTLLMRQGLPLPLPAHQTQLPFRQPQHLQQEQTPSLATQDWQRKHILQLMTQRRRLRRSGPATPSARRQPLQLPSAAAPSPPSAHCCCCWSCLLYRYLYLQALQ